MGTRREIIETITEENSEVFVKNDPDYYVKQRL
jgi:hypothetical protein